MKKYIFAYDDNPYSGNSMFFPSWKAVIDHWEKEFKSRSECEKWMQGQVKGIVVDTRVHREKDEDVRSWLDNGDADAIVRYAKKYGKLTESEKKDMLVSIR